MEWGRRKGHSQVGLPPISDTPQVCDGIDGGQEGYLVLRPAPARLLWELDSFSMTQELALAPHRLQLRPPCAPI